MDVETALKTRRSIRKFKTTPVPDEIVAKILELANTAPSAGNLQSRDFIVVQNDEVKAKLAKAALAQEFVYEAPVVIVVCGNEKRSGSGYGSRGKNLYNIQDADAAVMHILLSAHALNLGTCWVGAFDDDKVSVILGLPEYIKPIAIITIGYPEKTAAATSRVPIEKLVHTDKW